MCQLRCLYTNTYISYFFADLQTKAPCDLTNVIFYYSDASLSSDEFVVILNANEIKEVEKMLEKDSAQSTTSKKSLEHKIKTITKQKRVSQCSTVDVMDEFEIIDDEEVLALPSTLPPCPGNHCFSGRAFSLDSLKPKRTRQKVLDHRMSYPEMTQSCANFGENGTSFNNGTCDGHVFSRHNCGGACVHVLQSPTCHFQRKCLQDMCEYCGRRMKESKDSGMDSSHSIELVSSPKSEQHSSRLGHVEFSGDQYVPDPKLSKENKKGEHFVNPSIGIVSITIIEIC